MNKVTNASDAVACPGRDAAHYFLLRCARDTGARRPAAAWCEEPTYACGRIRSLVSGLLLTMKTATRTCKPSARCDAEARRCASLPFIPRKRESRAKRSSFGILGPRNGVPATRASRGAPRGDERMLHEGGAYFAGLGFELRSGAPPALKPKLLSSSSAA